MTIGHINFIEKKKRIYQILCFIFLSILVLSLLPTRHPFRVTVASPVLPSPVTCSNGEGSAEELRPWPSWSRPQAATNGAGFLRIIKPSRAILPPSWLFPVASSLGRPSYSSGKLHEDLYCSDLCVGACKSAPLKFITRSS